MRSIQIALLGALAATGLGLAAPAPAAAQDGYAPGVGYYRVSRPLPIRIRPRSWLDAGNVVEPGNGSVSNPATNPVLIAQSNALNPPFGNYCRFARLIGRSLAGPGRHTACCCRRGPAFCFPQGDPSMFGSGSGSQKMKMALFAILAIVTVCVGMALSGLGDIACSAKTWLIVGLVLTWIAGIAGVLMGGGASGGSTRQCSVRPFTLIT